MPALEVKDYWRLASVGERVIARIRRERPVDAQQELDIRVRFPADQRNIAAFDRLKSRVQHNEAYSHAKAELTGDSMEDRLASLEKQDQVEKLLTELKSKRGLGS